MQMNNVQFQSTSSNIELMLEAFFCVQLNEHVKAWRWHQRTQHCDYDAAMAGVMQAARELRNARL